MAKVDWIKSKKFTGVRWYEHSTRKNGIRKDRCFGIRYQVGTKRYENILGWESSGMTEAKAWAQRESLVEAYRHGEGPVTLAEKRALADHKRQEQKAEAQRLARENISFMDFFESVYLPEAQTAKKTETIRKEREHMSNWINPITRGTPMKEVGLGEAKMLKASLARAKRSPRTMQYVFRTFTSVWNAALDEDIVHTRCPVKNKSLKLPKVNNSRERYLTPEEADKLLAALKAKSPQTHDIALLSLHTGMRFGEIASLQWGCLDIQKGTIRILNAKADKNRTVYMTQTISELFKAMPNGLDNELVFPNRYGKKLLQVPSAFVRVVAELSLNEDVADPKLRFSFHGLRHTHASWLVQGGTDLYKVQRQLGHSTPAVTQRYAHLTEEDMKETATLLDRKTAEMAEKGKVVQFRKING